MREPDTTSNRPGPGQRGPGRPQAPATVHDDDLPKDPQLKRAIASLRRMLAGLVGALPWLRGRPVLITALSGGLATALIAGLLLLDDYGGPISIVVVTVLSSALGGAGIAARRQAKNRSSDHPNSSPPGRHNEAAGQVPRSTKTPATTPATNTHDEDGEGHEED